MTSQQFILEFPHRPAQGRSDFLVSTSNQEAVAWIDLWPDWPSGALILWGPEGCGKTHLSRVWQARSHGWEADMEALSSREFFASVPPGTSLFLENADEIGNETAFLHLLNWCAENKGTLLLTTRLHPKKWPIALADLRSRLRALAIATIREPDDALLEILLAKLFADRQTLVQQEVVRYLCSRIERSFRAAHEIVERINRHGLETSREITVPMVRRFF